jgi:hypothetical protein
VRAALDSPAFAGTFGAVSGDRLKRVPTGFAPDHPGAELLKLKDVTFGRPLADDEVLSADLPDLLADTYAAAVPVLRLLSGLAPDAQAPWLRRGQRHPLLREVGRPGGGLDSGPNAAQALDMSIPPGGIQTGRKGV